MSTKDTKINNTIFITFIDCFRTSTSINLQIHLKTLLVIGENVKKKKSNFDIAMKSSTQKKMKQNPRAPSRSNFKN